MGQDVKINHGAVKGCKTAINALVVGSIVQMGSAVVKGMEDAIRDSGGIGVIACKAYMKQEQSMMEVFGAGLDHMIAHINNAAEEMKALDEDYTKKRID